MNAIYAALTPDQRAARIEATKRWRAKQPKNERRRGIQPGTPEWFARAAANSRKWYSQNQATHVSRVRIRELRKAGALCACCAPISFKFIYLQARSLKMHVDHVQPLAKGGKHCLRNLQLLDPIENRRKGARWAEAA